MRKTLYKILKCMPTINRMNRMLRNKDYHLFCSYDLSVTLRSPRLIQKFFK